MHVSIPATLCPCRSICSMYSRVRSAPAANGASPRLDDPGTNKSSLLAPSGRPLRRRRGGPDERDEIEGRFPGISRQHPGQGSPHLHRQAVRLAGAHLRRGKAEPRPAPRAARSRHLARRVGAVGAAGTSGTGTSGGRRGQRRHRRHGRERQAAAGTRDGPVRRLRRALALQTLPRQPDLRRGRAAAHGGQVREDLGGRQLWRRHGAGHHPAPERHRDDRRAEELHRAGRAEGSRPRRRRRCAPS